jgi:hypothetical protein
MGRVLGVIAAVAVLCSASPAGADEAAPVAGCGADMTLSTVEETFGVIDLRIYTPEEQEAIFDLVRSVDGNGDGFLCWKQAKPNRGSDKHWGADDYVVTMIGENNAVGRQP